jgi:hypothetical protein
LLTPTEAHKGAQRLTKGERGRIMPLTSSIFSYRIYLGSYDINILNTMDEIMKITTPENGKTLPSLDMRGHFYNLKTLASRYTKYKNSFSRNPADSLTASGH